MTFIASVIAKEGVAIVADSFRTTINHSIEEDDFIEFIDNASDKENIKISELVGLFQEKASHTRNYVDKLIQFDTHSAICSTGAAYINGKEVKNIIKAISAEMQADPAAYEALSIDEKIKRITDKLQEEVFQHLETRNFCSTNFIFSHFNKTKNEPQVFIINIKKFDKDKFDKDSPPTDLIKVEDKSYLKIITDGQDTFVDRLIFGSLYRNMIDLKDGCIEYINGKFIPVEPLKSEFEADINHIDFLRKIVSDDIFSIKFRELSLQEAVDFAALLIKIVMDIQVYTEKIPTVGGVIRLAIINQDKGFEWIAGNNIISPKLI